MVTTPFSELLIALVVCSVNLINAVPSNSNFPLFAIPVAPENCTVYVPDLISISPLLTIIVPAFSEKLAPPTESIKVSFPLLVIKSVFSKFMFFPF